MTDRERILTDALRSVGKSIDAYLERVRRGDTGISTSPFLLLSVIHKDVERALDEVRVMSVADELIPSALDPVRDERMTISENPMTRVYGFHDGETCFSCVHLVEGSRGRKFMKCDRRKITHGPATDHRVRWPACGLWERRT